MRHVFSSWEMRFFSRNVLCCIRVCLKSRVAARVPHNQVVYHRIFPVRNTPFSDTTTAGLHLFVLFVLHFSATSRKAALTEEASSGPLFTYTGAKAETIGSLAEGAG